MVSKPSFLDLSAPRVALWQGVKVIGSEGGQKWIKVVILATKGSFWHPKGSVSAILAKSRSLALFSDPKVQK